MGWLSHLIVSAKNQWTFPVSFVIPPRPMTELTRCPKEERHGLSVQQWALLIVSFFLGIACVFTVDRLFLTEQPSGPVAHAAATAP